MEDLFKLFFWCIRIGFFVNEDHIIPYQFEKVGDKIIYFAKEFPDFDELVKINFIDKFISINLILSLLILKEKRIYLKLYGWYIHILTGDRFSIALDIWYKNSTNCAEN
jgi:hypothetical protein